MLGHLELDIEVSDAGMKITEYDDYRRVSSKDRDTNSMLAMSQTSFSLYLHNQWTDFHKLSCTGKPQMRAICTYVGCTKVTTND